MRTIKNKETFIKAFNNRFGNGRDLVFLRSDDRVILEEGASIVVTVGGESCSMPIFDYYTEDYQETFYQLNVLHQVNNWVNSVGWWSEAENAGTLQFLPN